MTNRNVYRVLTAAWLTCGVAAFAPVSARAQDISSLPKGHVTLVGCFLQMADPDDTDDIRWVLANPTVGPATSVPDPNCTATAADPVLRLTDVDDSALDQVATGRLMEIYGELGRARDGDDLRKFEVKSFKEVPITPPVAIVMPAPEPLAEIEVLPEPVPEETPAATSGIEPKELPHTASPLPLIALLGLFALSGGLVLGVVERRRASEHE